MNENYNSTPHELGWDDELTNEGSGGYVVLEEGDYNFRVTAFERARFPGSAKIPACNKATLTLAVETYDGEATVKYDLIMYSSLEWKIHEFFRAIGQKKSGESFRPRWNEVVGSRGRARFKPRKYIGRDGEERTTNDVVKFYDYDPAFFQAGNGNTQRAAQSAAPQGSWQAGKF